jgi:hypothetical protein
MKRILLTVGIACLITAGIPKSALTVNPAPAIEQAGGAQNLKRTVKGQTLTSMETPKVKLTFDKAFRYIGGQEFILYDVAQAEQHFFVEADKPGNIKRLYWIQFEGYLPSNTNAYRYKVTKTTTIGGLEFIADAAPRNIKGSQGRPDSDGNRARAFMASKGYKMASDEVLWQRLVHMVDEAKRNELMIIYMEDLSQTGLTAADLSPNGKAANQWEEVAKGLLERAAKGLKIVR